MDKQKVQIFNNSKNDLPNYSTDLAAGFDIRTDFSKVKTEKELKGNGLYEFINSDEGRKLILKPNGRVLLPTGLHVAIPDNYELQIRARSGLALKYGITVLNGIGTLDADYRGEIGIIIINTSDESFTINDGDRMAQGVLNEVKQCVWNSVYRQEELGQTDRDSDGFGTTGVK